MIFEEREVLEDNEEEQLSEYGDHIFVNSEFDSEFEEEDASKWRNMDFKKL